MPRVRQRHHGHRPRGDSCHGVQLIPAEAEEAGGVHAAAVERVEAEYLVRIEHPMTKRHYISFIAALSPDRVQLVKLYPEWSAGRASRYTA